MGGSDGGSKRQIVGNKVIEEIVGRYEVTCRYKTGGILPELCTDRELAGG